MSQRQSQHQRDRLSQIVGRLPTIPTLRDIQRGLETLLAEVQNGANDGTLTSDLRWASYDLSQNLERIVNYKNRIARLLAEHPEP